MSEYPNIPGYKIESKLGEGGMATVFLAVQENLKRKVALKVLNTDLLKDQTFASRFLTEAETCAALEHRNIITVFDVGQVANSLYISMERLSDSLKERIGKLSKIKADQAVNIVVQIASALNYAHSKKIIHRDIKSDNIMFRNDGTPVLVDFGIAKAIDASAGLTKTGFSVGTPLYMSPEQIRGKDLDGRSDIYSLGILFFEMLTGSVPYKATETIALAMKHVSDPIPQLPGDQSKYQPVLNRMLAKDPEDRYMTGNELIDALGCFVRETITSRSPDTIVAESLENIEVKKEVLTDTLEEKTELITKKPAKKKKIAIIGLVLILLILFTLTVFLVFKKDKKIIINEEELWNNTKITNTVSSYREYLVTFPTGKYATQARWWINTLSALEESKQRKGDKKSELSEEEKNKLKSLGYVE